MRRLVVIVGLLTTASVATAEPLAILRGIVLTQHGEARAYLEDPRTGTLRAYVAGDTVAEGQIEAIHEDRVILRRGNELSQLLMGPLASAQEREARTVRGGPTIGSGQPWLDHLGISSEALSRAIEQAPAPQDRNDTDD